MEPDVAALSLAISPYHLAIPRCFYISIIQSVRSQRIKGVSPYGRSPHCLLSTDSLVPLLPISDGSAYPLQSLHPRNGLQPVAELEVSDESASDRDLEAVESEDGSLDDHQVPPAHEVIDALTERAQYDQRVYSASTVSDVYSAYGTTGFESSVGQASTTLRRSAKALVDATIEQSNAVDDTQAPGSALATTSWDAPSSTGAVQLNETSKTPAAAEPELGTCVGPWTSPANRGKGGSYKAPLPAIGDKKKGF